MTEPRYEHDCDKCKYLGRWNEHDLWFCPQGSLGGKGSILARVSSEPADYQSIPVALLQDPELRTSVESVYVGFAVARLRGLV